MPDFLTKFGLITHLIDDVNNFRAQVKSSRSRQLDRPAQSDEDLVKFLFLLITGLAAVAWIVRSLLSHSVEEYILAVGGFESPSRNGSSILQKWKHFVAISIAERRVRSGVYDECLRH